MNQVLSMNRQPQQTLQVQVRNVYGVERVYPMNETAELFAQIAGTKTLEHGTLCLAERLGFRIETIAQPVRRAS